MYLRNGLIEIEFFGITGEFPILLENDFMDTLKASIDPGRMKFKLKEVGISKTFVLPGKNIFEYQTSRKVTNLTNIVGPEADVVMIQLAR